jgi:hypothetical protein
MLMCRKPIRLRHGRAGRETLAAVGGDKDIVFVLCAAECGYGGAAFDRQAQTRLGDS